MGSAVDGLVSGLSTTDLISQLMQAEAAPQAQIKKKITTVTTTQTALRSVNAKFSALQTAAHALRADDPLQSSVWKGTKATSTSGSATATSTSGAATGSVTFSVTGLAKGGVQTAVMPSTTGPATANGKVYLKVGTGDPIEIAVTDNTPQGVVNAINAKGAGATAALVTTDQGTVLQLTSSKTGTANAVTLDAGPSGDANGGLVVPMVTAIAATDAKIKVGSGDPATGGYTVTSSTNAFTGLMTGVTINATKEEDNITVTVKSDTTGAADKMAALIDAANAALADISSKSTYDATSKTAGPLLSNPLTRELSQNMLSTVSGGAADFGSFAQMGVQLDRSGKLSFDKTKFLEALTKDPAKIQAATTGLADKLETLAKKTSNSTDGLLTLSVQAQDAKLKDLNARVSDWDDRLKIRKEALQRQYSTLETSLSKLNNQSSWLSGQIASLG